MKHRILGLLAVGLLAGPMAAQAITYNVNRAWDDLGGSASLVGTVDSPLGSFTIMNAGPSPFTDVDLTLTVNGTAVILDHAFTGGIVGTGQFFIDATAASLTFSVANFNHINEAQLQFRGPTNFSVYVIGGGGSPGFEFEFGGLTPGAGGVIAFFSFPVTFGTASVPEPGTLALLGVGLLGFGLTRRRAN